MTTVQRGQSISIRSQDPLFTQWLAQWRLSPASAHGVLVALCGAPPDTLRKTAATIADTLGKRLLTAGDVTTAASKFIGETEKNLARLFDRAASSSAVLFFDEADALFGKRTGVSDAHDRYANQEVSYLLQRLTENRGVVIASFKSMPEAERQRPGVRQVVVRVLP